ncbi:MAG: NAD(P)H-dependent oxidoreductase [Hungatella hathewayi]|uniref:NAD(P)H-dependent oxidoreductase n=1 Tax=Hungatella TaxID=1649459 RepID=UPI0011DC803C|nr:NAD(P)H-dependent oxidoreductase [Hungatella hathewayi]MDU4973608.1 NAD(P)H-dependent oxidoreductase [Hungatella hathewayi]
MKVSVILGHPYENSFNSAIAATVVGSLKRNGHTVMFHDLYLENFNPVIPKEELVSDQTRDPLVKLHQQEIRETDGIIIIHPNWWGQPPAILKGWVDRVLRENVAYTFPEGDNGGGLPTGLLKAKAGLVFNTSNTPEKREIEIFGDPLSRLWKDCIFDFCGISVFDRIMFRIVADSSRAEREEWLNQTRNMVNHYFP